MFDGYFLSGLLVDIGDHEGFSAFQSAGTSVILGFEHCADGGYPGADQISNDSSISKAVGSSFDDADKNLMNDVHSLNRQRHEAASNQAFDLVPFEEMDSTLNILENLFHSVSVASGGDLYYDCNIHSLSYTAWSTDVLASENGVSSPSPQEENLASSSNEKPKFRHQHSYSLDGSTPVKFELLGFRLEGPSSSEEKKAVSASKLADLALVDPKRAKGIWANRQSAARSKERKKRYIVKLSDICFKTS